MGWASGSGIAQNVWDEVKKYIPKDKQKTVAKSIIDIFEQEDCDTMQETTLWDLVFKTCPKCKGEGVINNYACDKCEQYGHIER